MLDEAAHLAAALADQGQHDHIGLRAARDHAEQRALADAAATEETDALSPPAGQHRIHRAHAGAQRRDDGIAIHRIERRWKQRIPHVRRERLSVERLTQRIDDATEQSRADANRHRAGARDDAIARTYTRGITERHGQQRALAEADDLHWQRRLAGRPVISQISPTLARGPADSISRPTLRMTRPAGGMVST